MSTIGPVKRFPVTITTGNTVSAEVDLGGAYGNVMLGFGTFATAFSTRLQCSDESGGTYRNVYQNTITGAAVYEVASAVSNAYIPVHLPAQYVKVEATTAPSDTSCNFVILCSAN